MPRLMAMLYDRMMKATEQACLSQWRQELLANCSGSVLEIGAGTGASLPFYSDKVNKLVLTEPDPHMRSQLQVRCNDLRADGSAVVTAHTIEFLDVGDAQFDYVISSLVLCSVQDPEKALNEVYRVLKPGGALLFIEHVAADCASSRFRWQRRIEPLWKRIAGNCHLTRRTEQAIEAAGFEIESVARESLRKALPIVRPSIRGVARKSELQKG